MKSKHKLPVLLLLLGMAAFGPQAVLAGEHGGSEHGGSAVEGSHGHQDASAVIMEAAAVLEKEGYADLAKKLKATAK